MKYDEFRNFKITRTCNKEYKRYKSYKKFLRKDFHNRCAYCNTWDFIIEPLGFAIDHYVPRKTFKNIDKTFSNNYNNLRGAYQCAKQPTLIFPAPVRIPQRHVPHELSAAHRRKDW